ncbi:MAG: nucleotidyltransferase domain-containing protein [bacterium]|nr:nucleotidyltransferase domain-containing protein [bacterium]
MKSKDQQLVEKFIRELVKEIVKKHKKDIDFMILYGSAARGEFIKGVSDIDLVIQTKDETAVKPINKNSAEIFWKLNKKYKTGFEKSCKKSSNSLLGKVTRKLEKQAQLFTPLFVFGPKDMDWEKGYINKKDLILGAILIASQPTIFYKFKHEGKICYGRDIRKEINPRFNLWERYKGLVIPQHLIVFAMFIVPVMPRTAVKYCTKAILYEQDSALVYLNEILSMKKNKKLELEKATQFDLETKKLNQIIEFNLSLKYNFVKPKYFGIIEEALDYKRNGFQKGRKKAVSYVFRSLRFVLLLNWSVMIKRALRIQ